MKGMATNTQETVREALKAFFRREADRLSVDVAFLFGSWATGLPRADSDVDVGVVFSDQPPSAVAFDRVNHVALELGRALGTDIDVVVVDRDLSRPALAYQAVVRGTPVYVRDTATLADLRREAVREMEDFSLFGVEWQLQAARVNLRRGPHA